MMNRTGEYTFTVRDFATNKKYTQTVIVNNIEEDITALKFLVNSGDDGIVVLPIDLGACDVAGGYQIAWGDGKTGYDGTLEKDGNDNAPTTNWRTQWMLYSMDNTKVWSPGMQAAFGGKFYILKSIDSTSWSNVTDFYNDPLGNARLSGNDISEKKQNLFCG